MRTKPAGRQEGVEPNCQQHATQHVRTRGRTRSTRPAFRFMYEHHTTGCDWAWRRVQAHMMAQHRTSDTTSKRTVAPAAMAVPATPKRPGAAYVSALSLSRVRFSPDMGSSSNRSLWAPGFIAVTCSAPPLGGRDARGDAAIGAARGCYQGHGWGPMRVSGSCYPTITPESNSHDAANKGAAGRPRILLSRLECGSTSHHHKVATISAPPTPIIKLQCARTSKHVPSRHPLLGLRSTFPTLTGDSSTKSSVWASGSDRLPGGGHRACSPRRGPVPLLQLCRRRPRWKVAGCMGVFIAPSSRWRATWI